jgi:hypothetical protein
MKPLAWFFESLLNSTFTATMPNADVTFFGLPLSDAEQARLLDSSPARVVLAPGPHDSTQPNPWRCLPTIVASLAANPDDWAAIAIRGPVKDSHEAVVDAALQGELHVLAHPPLDLSLTPTFPKLAPAELPVPAWKRKAIEELDERLPAVRSQVDLTALKAGLLQLGDHLTESHEHSQQIEGRGLRQAGDYWHAIHHRREPDDGNAKYWFRRVGSHPVLDELGAVLPRLADRDSSDIAKEARTLAPQGRLDPFRLVDFISETRRKRDPEQVRFAQRLQWCEMIALLEWTVKDAVG